MVKCCDLHAGMLSTTVQFQRLSPVTDGAGGYAETWLPLSGAVTRAHVVAMSGAERYASGRVEATAKFRVTVRYFAGLRESDAVTINGARHNIRFINNVEQSNRWLVLDVDGGVVPQ